MDVRIALIIVGLFYFGMGIVLLIWWSAPIRLIFLNPDYTATYSFTGEIIALTAPPLLSAVFGAIIFLFHNHSISMGAWRIFAWAMLLTGMLSLALQAAYPIYINVISGMILQVFPGMALIVMSLIIFFLQPFAITGGFQNN